MGNPRTVPKPYYPAPTPRQNPYVEAHNALTNKNYPRAELLAQKILQDTSISAKAKADASLIYAKAASMNKHPHAALTSLDGWRLATPGADITPLWQEIWSDSMAQLYSHEGKARAMELLNDPSRSTQVHNLADIYLAVKLWENGSAEHSCQDLQQKYLASPSKSAKILMEIALARELQRSSTTAVSTVAEEVTPENKNSFPYNIILVDQLRRQLNNPATHEEAQNTLTQLQQSLNLADPDLIHGPKTNELEPLSIPSTPVTPIESGSISGKPVILALPLSGPFSTISAKIVAGAKAACAVTGANKVASSLVVIDTDQPDWLARIEGLPKDAVAIGGPLRTSDFAAIKSQGLTNKKVFFAFLPSLEHKEEGTVAWRFFYSPEDQVRALTSLTYRIGIKGYGILYPDDIYGQKMALLFEEQVYQTGAASVQKVGYPPKSPASWLRSTGSLLATNKNPESASSATFQAIFLPDNWKSTEILMQNIFYYGETKQLLLGSALWGQAISSGKISADPQYLSFAVFPGAFTPMASEANNPSISDFWEALGYDFARFASGFTVQAAFSAGDVNTQLQNSRIEWTMAPISWSLQGIAQQEMYLFTPVSGGFAVLNESEFIDRFTNAWK